VSGDAELSRQVKRDYRRAELTPRERALADLAIKVTREPASDTRDDLETLRQHGLGDTGILELVHIIGYFNYINRLADALGVELEDFMPPRET
jgi:uncharacterized peroxidase-related enzyme